MDDAPGNTETLGDRARFGNRGEYIMKPFTVALAAIMLSCFPVRANADTADPVSVMRSFFDAEHAGNADAALALSADDGRWVNTRGVKRVGHEEVMKFIRGAINAKVVHTIVAPRREGEKATWTESQTT